MEKKQLADLLNQDLAGEFQAILMYTVYAAQVKGPDRPQLAQFMKAEIADELLHAQFLADKIVSLGGIPTTEPRQVPSAVSTQDMLENIAKAEEQAIAGYTTRAEQAREAGQIGLAVQLENMVLDETGHSEETKKLLENWR
ncbi:MAG TPA: ferritin-like domain-containing protein [Aggregatilineales bacterium]|nr:ferritin-like domain-containing protein [Aggregatilineales bacterium]